MKITVFAFEQSKEPKINISDRFNDISFICETPNGLMLVSPLRAVQVLDKSLIDSIVISGLK